MTAQVAILLTVNGERVEAQVLPRLNLADFLREHLKLTGTHVGCEHGVCGACTVRVGGEIVRSCLTLAVQVNGAAVETIEGLSDSGEIADLQTAFRDRNALQCGFCRGAVSMLATWSCRGWRMSCSCARRMRMRKSWVSTPRPRGRCLA